MKITDKIFGAKKAGELKTGDVVIWNGYYQLVTFCHKAGDVVSFDLRRIYNQDTDITAKEPEHYAELTETLFPCMVEPKPERIWTPLQATFGAVSVGALIWYVIFSLF